MNLLTLVAQNPNFGVFEKIKHDLNTNQAYRNNRVKKTTAQDLLTINSTDTSTIDYGEEIRFNFTKGNIYGSLMLNIAEPGFTGSSSNTCALTDCIEYIAFYDSNAVIYKYDKQKYAIFLDYIRKNKISDQFYFDDDMTGAIEKLYPIMTPYSNLLENENEDEPELANFVNLWNNLNIRIKIVDKAADFATSDGTITLPSKFEIFYEELKTLDDNKIITSYVDKPFKTYGNSAPCYKEWTQTGTTLDSVKINIITMKNVNINGFFFYIFTGKKKDFLNIQDIYFSSAVLSIGTNYEKKYDSKNKLTMENWLRFGYFPESTNNNGLYYVPLVYERENMDKSKLNTIKLPNSILNFSFTLENLSGLTNATAYNLIAIPYTIDMYKFNAQGAFKNIKW